jgi:Zn-finger nucleic acid-binding protein
MNFIGNLEGREVHVELKYCERCGGLWLRAQGAEGVYCASCRARLAEAANNARAIAPPRKTQRRKRGVHQTKGAGGQSGTPRITGQIDYLEGVAAMEVCA